MRIPSGASRALRRHRWFGVPRWAWLGGLAGLIAFAAVYGPWSQPSPQVRAIVAGLRSSSVYMAPGAPGVVDPARVRQVIGDRPIVVAILDRTPLPPNSKGTDPRLVLCDQIAGQVSNDYVWVYAADDKGRYRGNDCYGPNFPHPTKAGVGMDDFDLSLNIEAQLSAQFRTSDTNLTPEIEEFVLAFDADTTADYGAVPTRSALPDELAGQQIVLACAGMVFGAAALFLLLRHGGLALRRRMAGHAALRHRHLALTARLNEIADAVINPGRPADARDAERQADVAKRYVLALDQVEHARTGAELTSAEAEIASLAGELATEVTG